MINVIYYGWLFTWAYGNNDALVVMDRICHSFVHSSRTFQYFGHTFLQLWSSSPVFMTRMTTLVLNSRTGKHYYPSGFSHALHLKQVVKFWLRYLPKFPLNLLEIYKKKILTLFPFVPDHSLEIFILFHKFQTLSILLYHVTPVVINLTQFITVTLAIMRDMRDTCFQFCCNYELLFPQGKKVKRECHSFCMTIQV